MESYNTDCENANKDYIKKYNSLLSMVNGYDQFNDNNSLNELTDLTGRIKKIINKTLISENDFEKLKKEQNDIMNEYEKLEKIKTGDPFSSEALEYSKELEPKNNSSNLFNKIEKKFNINISDKPQSKNIKLSKMPLEQKLSCDGSINQYYKMPDICININTKESDTKVKKERTRNKITKSKVKNLNSKIKVTNYISRMPKIKSKSKRSKVKSKKSKYKSKKREKQKLKCKLNNKINNHKLF